LSRVDEHGDESAREYCLSEFCAFFDFKALGLTSTSLVGSAFSNMIYCLCYGRH
jgi:hypothetical protein